VVPQRDENFKQKKVITAEFSRGPVFLTTLYVAHCITRHKQPALYCPQAMKASDSWPLAIRIALAAYIATEENISIKYFAVLSYFKISFTA